MVTIKRTLFAFFSFCFLTIIQNAYADTPVPRPDRTKEAEIVEVKGDGWVRFIKGKEWTDAVRQQALTSGDTLKTGSFGKMHILFVDEMQITMHTRTTLVIKEVRRSPQQKRSVLRVESGELWGRAKKISDGLQIETPSATAAIRGTDWDILVDEKGSSYLTVLRGFVELYNDFGKVIVGPGEQGSAEVGKPPTKTILVKPKDRVQWFVSYHLDVVKLVPFYSYRRQEVIKLLPDAKKASEKNPGDIPAKLMLAGLLFDLKEKKESLMLFDEILKSDPQNPRALTFRGFLELDKGNPDHAETYFNQAMKQSRKGEDIEPLVGIVGVHLQKNQTEDAAGLIEKLGKTRPSPLSDVMTCAFQAYQGNFRKAIHLCRSYGDKYPDQEIFPTLIAHFYLILDEPENAKEWIDKASAINPEFAHVHAFLGEYFYIEGRGDEAEAALQKALDIDPKNDIALDVLGLFMYDKGNYEEALRLFSSAIELYPRDSIFYANRGVVFAGTGDMEKAREDYQRAAGLDPGNFETFKGLGYIALAEGKTDEAVQYLLKSSLMMPYYANPHIYLAIAYYQQGNISRALDELKLAEELDPRDPLPHVVAQIIYQDLFRPFDAIQEATKALELLPYLKSVVPIENTKSALADLGSALLSFDLAEWAGSYSQESYDPHRASSHFFAALQYADNPFVSASELITGLGLDPLAVSSPNRYQDIIRRPRHDATVGMQFGSEDGGFSQSYNAIFQGYCRRPLEVSYYLSLSKYDQDGFRGNGYSEGNSLFFGIGLRPDYKNGFFTYGWTSESKEGEPGYITNPDPDDRSEQRSTHISLGYHHRFGYRNDLLARFAYQKADSEFLNPYPYGTGLTDIMVSFIQAFGTDTARGFFQKGIYDITEIIGGTNLSLVTDSTGATAESGLSPLDDAIPLYIDSNPLARYHSRDEVLALQARHLVTIGNAHQVSYGFEYIPDKVSTSLLYNDLDTLGAIDFCDEIGSEAPACSTFTHYASSTHSFSSEHTLRFLTAYIHDRWQFSKNVLLEGGLFCESLEDQEDYTGVHPRFGIAVAYGKNIVRLGFQKWLELPSAGTLSPVSSAGLVVDNSLALVGSRLDNYQARIETRWSGRLFTSVQAERVELTDSIDPLALVSQGRTNSISFAVNSILTKNTGLFLRYTYTDSRNEDNTHEGNDIPLIPEHAAHGGFVWVSPLNVKASLITSYTGRRYGDPENRSLLSDYFTTDLAIIWEPLGKRTLFSLSVKNLFDEHYETYQGYPAAGRSVYMTAEYRL
ncbi:MAG: tetratricopeptide repeat protein [Nitrospirota bacterium]